MLKSFGPEERKMKKTVKKSTRDQTIFLICIMALPILNWLVFWLYVNINSILLAFQDRLGNWTLENFGEFWTSLIEPVDYGGSVQLALLNTLKYFAADTFVMLPVALILSYFIYKRIVGYRAFRILFYLPSIISAVALTTVYKEFINPNGPLGEIFGSMGISVPPEGYLARNDTATKVIVIYYIWAGCGTNILLLGGAMSRIPPEIMEAAKLDGVGPGREIVNFILPLIWPTLSTLLIFILTAIFTVSGPILLFQPNGDYNTSTISFWIFKQVYGNGSVTSSVSARQINLISCTGLCFTLVGVPLIYGVRKLLELVPTVEY